MIVFPNAKINIGLNIIEKRSDGYHTIESIFYPINVCDILEIIPSDAFEFSMSGRIVEENGENICQKAYKLLKNYGQIDDIKIHLHKNIPIGAGLGGGSSDATFTLQLLNKMFALNLTPAELKRIAAQLGSDCPFFVSNKAAYLKGKGEELQDINLSLKGYYYILVYPGIHISTREAYQNVQPRKPDYNLKEVVLQKDISEWKKFIVNDFEENLFDKYPVLQEVKDTLYNNGALYASMSGSGSSVYGIFHQKQEGASKLFPEKEVFEGFFTS